MQKGFLEALKEWRNKGSDPHEVIFITIKKQIHQFTQKQNTYHGKIDLRGFLEIESYNDFLEQKLWEEKLLKGGFDYIITASNDEEHALGNLRFLISQMNNNLGLEINPEIITLKTILNDHFDNLFSDFFKLSDIIHSKAEVTLIRELDFDDVIDIIEKSKRHNKNYRLKVMYSVIDLFSDNKTIKYSDILKSVKEQIGINDSSTISINPQNDDENENFTIDLVENDSDYSSIINKEVISKKLNDFSAMLTNVELIILTNWLDVTFNDGINPNEESFNKRQQKLSDELNIKKSAIYGILKKTKSNLKTFLEKFDQDEQKYIINLILDMIKEGNEKC